MVKFNKALKSGLAGLAILFSNTVFAATINPESFEATLEIGETITVNKTVTLGQTAVSKLDLVFLADVTGSMGSELAAIKSSATSMLSQISAQVSDVNFASTRYNGDPSESGFNLDTAFEIGQTLTDDNSSVVSAINNWNASGGGDFPEANLYALNELATSGSMGGKDVGWRDNSAKVVVWFGDATSHEATVTKEQTLANLIAQGITVIAIDVGAMDSTGQATYIADGTGGILADATSSTIVDTILSKVGDATSKIDIELAAVGDTSGLDIVYQCVDARGCTDVGAGESRELTMTVTAKEIGVWDYDTIAIGTDGVEKDTITVVSTKVPEPAGIAMFGIAMMGLVAVRRKK